MGNLFSLVLLLLVLLLRVGGDFSGGKGGGGGGGGGHGGKSKRVYSQQFADGSEQQRLPSGGIINFSIYLGHISYPYVSLTVDSMRRNPDVQFVLINVVKDPAESKDIQALVASSGIRNFHVEVITYGNFSERVNEKLGISVNFNSTYFYKMTDYKPTLAYLFPELIDAPPPLGLKRAVKYAFWSYSDTDLIWGNFTRFAHLFNGDYAVITSDFQGASGVAMFFKNEEWTRRIFKDYGDPLFTQLLRNVTDYQLDEFSRKGIYEEATMDRLIKLALKEKGQKSTQGLHWKDKLWLEQDASHVWAGPVRWFRGTLQIIHGSPEFPPGRELLIYHRPSKEYDLYDTHSIKIASDIEQDMMTYGYLLPNWIPLLTRHLCPRTASEWQSQSTAIERYRPYSRDCFAKHGVSQRANVSIAIAKDRNKVSIAGLG